MAPRGRLGIHRVCSLRLPCCANTAACLPAAAAAAVYICFVIYASAAMQWQVLKETHFIDSANFAELLLLLLCRHLPRPAAQAPADRRETAAMAQEACT